MKVNNNSNGFEISARDANVYKRGFLYNISFLFFVINTIFFIFGTYNSLDFQTVFINLIIYNAIMLIITLLVLSCDKYYLVKLSVVDYNLKAIFYIVNKKHEVALNFSNLNIKLTDYGAGKMSVRKKVVIFEGKNRIFEIRPHNSVIYREYKDDDIEEIYNLLIEHQNKLIQQETTE